MVNYPGNSRKARDEERKPKKVEKVISGDAVRRKKSLGKRFIATFVGDDSAGGVFNYIIQDVLVPAAKDTISDAVSQGIERMLFGEVRGRGGYRSRGGPSYTAYNRYSSIRSSLDRREEPRKELSRRARVSHDFDEIVLETRAEAEEVIDKMFEMLSQYDVVTVADLYELIGLSGNFTDEKFGWTDLRGAGVTRVKGGYLLNLPRTEPLD
jgi:hypothetical protein